MKNKKCNHIVGLIINNDGKFDDVLEQGTNFIFKDDIEAIPFISVKFNYCPNCGTKND
jgi:hypothetical protein